jgi:hypothetical protein
MLGGDRGAEGAEEAEGAEGAEEAEGKKAVMQAIALREDEERRSRSGKLAGRGFLVRI